MKIISKFKDYYDYLQGIYGIDEKLILDRTKYTPIPYTPSDFSTDKIIIGDYLIQGIWLNGKFHCGKDVEDLDIISNYNHPFGNDIRYLIKSDFGSIELLKEPKLLTDSPAYQHNCSILIKDWNGYKKNPILKEYSLYKVYSAFEIWNILSEFLGKLNDKHSQSIQTDKEKIISHGFDLKTSFRKIK